MTDPTSAADQGPRRPGPGPQVALPRYRLGTGIRLVPRGADLQIGTAIGRRVLLTDPPPSAERILDALDGSRPADGLLAGEDDQHWWAGTLHELHRAGLLHGDRVSPVAPGLVDERVDLTHRHGADTADLALGRRADAIIEIRGAGRVAVLTAGLLSASGVGHVHLTRTRPTRASDALVETCASHSRRPAAHTGAADSSTLRTTSASTPAQLRPTVVVLAGDTPAESTAAADLMTSRIPHLALGAGDGRAVVGPLVLPGRSSCLWCLDLGRADRDPEWATLRLEASVAGCVPSAVLAAGAAALGTAEVLQVVEGVRQPLTVDGTVEWDAALLPRRRTWRPHPDCGCTHRS